MNDDMITITGNVATPPERRTAGATPITSFRLASTQRRFDKESGKWIDSHTNWFTVSAYRQLAVHALDSLQKGQRVIVTGKLRIRTWENASGKGTSVDIEADAIGHDLLFGTSDFHKDLGAAGGAAQTQVTDWPVESPGSAEDWAPSLASDEPLQTPPPPAPVPEPARELAFAGEEAPF